MDRALAQDPADQLLRADLLRLLGTVLSELVSWNGHNWRLAEGSQVAAAAGAVAGAGPDPGPCSPTCEACKAPETTRRWPSARRQQQSWEAEDDLEGLAEALTAGSGKARFWSATQPRLVERFSSALSPARGKAATTARKSGPATGLAVTFHVLPIPVDAGIARAEELLREASGDSAGPKRTCSAAVACCTPSLAFRRRPRGAGPQPVDCFRSLGARLALAEALSRPGLSAWPSVIRPRPSATCGEDMTHFAPWENEGTPSASLTG